MLHGHFGDHHELAHLLAVHFSEVTTKPDEPIVYKAPGFVNAMHYLFVYSNKSPG
jgi:hypothetical protein